MSFLPILLCLGRWNSRRLSFLQRVRPGHVQGGRRVGGNLRLSSRTQRGLVRSDGSSEPLSEQPVSPRSSSQVVRVIPPTATQSPPLTTLRASVLCSRCVQGVCVPKAASYSCRCNEGFQGSYCDRRQEPPACRGWRCGHGECRVAESGEPVCHCQPGYTGPTCDTGNECFYSILECLILHFTYY